VTALPPDELRRAYDRSADGYDERFAVLQAAKYGAIFERFRPDAGARVLDLGCGTGLLLPKLAEHSALPVALDLSGAMLAHVRWPAPRVQASSLALPFAPASFDAVFAVTSLLLDRRGFVHALVEIARILRPGGTAAITILSRDTYEGLSADFAASGLAASASFPCGQDTGWICQRA
jgi:SAM-dependent methyltransferase